ncbi:unnamed protein product [Peronospora destructor]|uniref:Uncharacterized protein n=1 Tax=Peronospora destructor TaxID=86335 RepID=A0AAV0VHH5_9STRA|nr:unnamed protein product [Peronospora destructor]
MWRRLARSSATVARRSSIVYCVSVSQFRTYRSLCLPSNYCLATISRTFASASARYESRAHDVKVRDFALHELVRRPWFDLQEYCGPIEMSKVRQTLPLVWKKLISHAQGSGEMASEIVDDFYEVARRWRLPKLQRDVFSYMETHFLECVSFEMYGQMFTNLLAAKEAQTMRAIFERAMTRYDLEQGQTPPEIVYRLGIGAAIALDDYAGVKTLMREMEAKGVKPSIEIVTRVMVAQATNGDVKTVVKAAESLNLQSDKKLHEADLNRVITSLGIAGEPDAAFEFYRKSQVRLSSKTLMTLLLVCRKNARPKHALAVLSNRRSFGLKMLPEQYPMLLEIVEELNIGGAPGNEMASIYEEMRADNVPFTERVHALIARNQQHLHGTPFLVTPSAEGEMEAQLRTNELDLPLLHKLVDARKYGQAAAIMDSYVLPVSNDMISSDKHHGIDCLSEECTVVPPWLADIAVEVYSHNQEIEKVRSLLRGFLCVRGDFRHALSRIVGIFGGKGKLRDNRIAYEAFLAMQFQGLQIFRIRDALTLFKQNQDTKAALLLLWQVSKQIAGAMKDAKTAARHQEDFMRTLKSSGVLNFDPRRAIILIRMEYQYGQANMRTSLAPWPRPLVMIGKLYTPNEFMLVWDDMTRRSVAPSKAILRVVVPVMCGSVDVSINDSESWKGMKLFVLRGYHQAVEDRHDKYVLPVACFSMLLEAAVEIGTIEDVNVVYAGAVKTLRASTNKKHYSPADHSRILEAWNTTKSKKAADEHGALRDT